MLVIDDLHELQRGRGADVARAVPRAACRRSCAWSWRPAQEPQLGLHRLRLAGGLVEVRAADLRFSQDETPGVARGERDRALGRGGGPPSRAHRRVGRRPAAGRDLARRAPRPRAVREGVLRQRAHGRRLSAGGGAGAPAGGGPRAAAAHLDPRPGERTAGRLPHRLIGFGADSAGASRTPTPSSPRSTWRGRGSATTTCSPTCCASSSAGPIPPASRSLHRKAASWHEEHGYPVEAIRHAQAARGLAACRAPARRQLPRSAHRWPHARRSASCSAPFRPRLRQRTRSWHSPRPRTLSPKAALEEVPAYIDLGRQLADTVPDERRPRFDLHLATSGLRSRADAAISDVVRRRWRRWRRHWRRSRRRSAISATPCGPSRCRNSGSRSCGPRASSRHGAISSRRWRWSAAPDGRSFRSAPSVTSGSPVRWTASPRSPWGSSAARRRSGSPRNTAGWTIPWSAPAWPRGRWRCCGSGDSTRSSGGLRGRGARCGRTASPAPSCSSISDPGVPPPRAGPGRGGARVLPRSRADADAVGRRARLRRGYQGAAPSGAGAHR